jgi:hypothetical protein
MVGGHAKQKGPHFAVQAWENDELVAYVLIAGLLGAGVVIHVGVARAGGARPVHGDAAAGGGGEADGDENGRHGAILRVEPVSGKWRARTGVPFPDERGVGRGTAIG